MIILNGSKKNWKINKLMKIENVNIEICYSRLQNNKPSFFVNWQENGKNKYKFFQLRFACEDFKNRLKQLQNETLKL